MTMIAKSVTPKRESDLPEGWRWAKLGDVCKVVSGSTPDTTNSSYWDGGIVWITPTDLGKLTTSNISGSARRITETGYNNSGTDIVPPGSVVMSSRAPIGHLGIATVPLCTNQGCKSFVPKTDVDAKYLFFALKRSVDELRALGSGATFAEVSKSTVEAFQIPLPPLPEQQRLAVLLAKKMEAVDAARAAAEAQLSAIKQLPASYLRAAFSGATDGDFTENEDGIKSRTSYPLRGTAFDKDAVSDGLVEAKSLLPDGWRWARLGDVCNINPRRPVLVRADDALTSFVSMSAVDEDGCGGIHAELKPFSAVRKGYTYFESGDVLFAKITPCMQNGKIAVARNLTDDFGFGSTEFHVLRPVPGLMADWVQRYISQPWLLREAMAHFTGSVGQQRVPEAFLANLTIPVPSTLKQQEIVASLDQKMSSVNLTQLAAEGQLAAIIKLPSALLREAFSGRI